jgi:hypothetical protein
MAITTSGTAIDDATIPQARCKIIDGSHHPSTQPAHGAHVRAKAPDPPFGAAVTAHWVSMVAALN